MVNFIFNYNKNNLFLLKMTQTKLQMFVEVYDLTQSLLQLPIKITYC